MKPLFNLRKQLELYFFWTLVIISFSYGVFKIYPLILGPKIIILSPKDKETVSSSTFIVSGKVSRVKNIVLQGRPIVIDKEGNFNEILVAEEPSTKIILIATDLYDKTTIKTLEVLPKK